MTHRNAFALAGRKSFDVINSGQSVSVAPSYVLLGFQPEGKSKQNNANTAREHGSAKTIPLRHGKCENPKSGKEIGRFCLYCCIFAF